jgi:hypothetical protein
MYFSCGKIRAAPLSPEKSSDNLRSYVFGKSVKKLLLLRSCGCGAQLRFSLFKKAVAVAVQKKQTPRESPESLPLLPA